MYGNPTHKRESENPHAQEVQRQKRNMDIKDILSWDEVMHLGISEGHCRKRTSSIINSFLCYIDRLSLIITYYR